MSQYEMTISYIHREDNCVADTLSRLPPDMFPDKNPTIRAPHEHWKTPICAVLSIATDISVLASIKEGYDSDPFCQHLAQTGALGAQFINGLWYVRDQLVIPCTGHIHENLFQLAHNTLRHFGMDKSYMVLRDSYYWPNMRTDLEKSYIPSCKACQCNKSWTTKAPGPLHPLPVPDE